jgi:hypothetical protein
MSLTEEQMEALYDKQCLYENLMMYCRGADRQDLELMKSTYWPDAIDDHGGYIGSPQGWADSVAGYKDRIHLCNHHTTNVLCEIEGDRAKRESMFLCVVTFKEPEVAMIHGGRYRDLCEKRAGVWKVLRRTCIWDWCDVRKITPNWDMSGVPRMSNWGTHYPEDPIYKDWFASSPTPRPHFQDRST